MNKRVYVQNIIAGAIVAALAVGAFLLASGMPPRVAIFPRLGSGVIFALAAAMCAVNAVRLRRDAPTNKKPVSLSSFRNPALTMLIVVVYVVAISFLGFYTATAAMMIGYMYFLGQRSAKNIFGVTAVVMVLVYFFFSVQLKVPLPKGWFF